MNDFYESGIPGYEEEFLKYADRQYLNQFWLDVDVLVKEWGDVLDRSFVISGKCVSIAPVKDVDVRRGGVLFAEEEFKQFKRLALQSGAKNFVVVEDIGQQDWREITVRSFFRFSYPLVTTWDEVASSCSIAEDIFLRPIRAYFVVVDNGQLGKYANNDAEKPYDLVFMEKD